VIITTARQVTGGLGMMLVTAGHGRDQKNNQCCIVPGSRKQCQRSAKHVYIVAMRALACSSMEYMY